MANEGDATIMSSESADTPEPPVPADTTPSLPTDLLRGLLNDPKPKDEVWQDSAGRAVSILAVGFLKEPDDQAALRSVALLALAQSLGVKEARKRSVKLSRWTDVAPPPLSRLTVKDEQHAALNALAKVRAAWSRSYAEQSLADPALPDELVGDVLKWARATFSDAWSFVHDFYAPRIAVCASAERLAVLLKEAPRLLKLARPTAAAEVAKSLSALTSSFCQSARTEASDDKAFVAGVLALLGVAEDHAAALPAVLLQPAFASSMGQLSAAAAKGAASKPLATAADTFALATVSLLMADVEWLGAQAITRWHAMVPTWRAVYPRWDDHIKAAAGVQPAVAALAADGSPEVPSEADGYAAEAVFARLLPAWDAFVADLPDPGRASSLTAMLRQAAQTLGVEPLGSKGDVVDYDPLSHHLAEQGNEVPRQVSIVRPGVQARRADGSARVLVPALVAAA